MVKKESFQDQKNKNVFLIFLCWLLYITSQLGRYSYTSNLNFIMSNYGVTHSQAGVPTTLFFSHTERGRSLTALFVRIIIKNGY